MDLYVIQPGAKVFLRDGLLEAKVLQVSISSNHQIRYQVSWWSNDTRHESWVDVFELQTPGNVPSLRIGFRKEK